MANRHDVETLKAQWLDDPCFDLTGQEGYEEFEDELRVFQASTEAEWARNRQAELARKANELGCPDNLKLASYVDMLEYRLDTLEESIRELRSRGR